MLAELPEESWDRPTLCGGWRVREVVAHMTMPFRYRAPKIILELVKAGGHFNKMADRLARRDAVALSDSALAEAMRHGIDDPWKPPGGGHEGALSHDIIHGLDITVPLGIPRTVPEDRLRAVLPGLATAKRLKYFGVDLTGVELRATDMEWAYGGGEPLWAPAQNLLLILCGRRLPTEQLSGEAAQRFTAG